MRLSYGGYTLKRIEVYLCLTDYLPSLIVDNYYENEETPYIIRVDGVYRESKIKVRVSGGANCFISSARGEKVDAPPLAP